MRTAVLGYGYWGANLARNVAAGRTTDLVAVVDPDGVRLDQCHTTHPRVTVHTDARAVLGDDRVEAVVVATPATLHEGHALAAIAAGKHVLVEKPMALTVAGAERFVAAAESAAVCAMVGHTFLYAPALAAVEAAIRSGLAGEVQYVSSRRLSPSRVRRDCNVVWTLAPHDVSILLHLLGEAPLEVSARGAAMQTPDTEDVAFLTLQFASGVVANVHLSWLDPVKVRTVTVVGDRGTIMYDDVVSAGKVAIVSNGAPDQIRRPNISRREPLRVEVEEFGSCVRLGRRPLADARSGLAVVRVLAAAEASMAAGGAPVSPKDT